MIQYYLITSRYNYLWNVSDSKFLRIVTSECHSVNEFVIGRLPPEFISEISVRKRDAFSRTMNEDVNHGGKTPSFPWSVVESVDHDGEGDGRQRRSRNRFTLNRVAI